MSMWKVIVFVLYVTSFTIAQPKRRGKNSHHNHEDIIPIPKNMLQNQPETYDDEEEILDYEYGREDYEDSHNNSSSTTSASSDKTSSTTPASLLLPSVVPDGDPSTYALPVFLEEPSDAFAVKSKSAILQCRVAHALDVHFQCNSEVVSPSSRKDLVEPESGSRYTEATVEISREKIEEFFGDYHCACVAISGKGSVLSAYALVSYAYLKKEFEVPPYSQQVSKGRQVEMRCHPPRGRPTPQIYWAQNGRRIDPVIDKNFIVTGEGHLIIVSAKLSDSANYTCVAHNVANIRSSDPASITVFVDGGWSNWSRWSSCSAHCGKGLQKRTRICDSPSPINGGQTCQGSPLEKKNCVGDCAGSMDGGWSNWSSWSSCSPECFQHRRRTCSNPKPKKSGRYCVGEDLESLNCTDGFCQGTRQLVMYGSDAKRSGNEGDNSASTGEDSPSSSTLDVTLYIVLSLAFLVFMVVILIIVKLLRRKNNHPNGYTLTSTDYGYGSSSEDGKKPGLGYSPDITQHGPTIGGGSVHIHPHHLQPPPQKAPTTVCYEYSYPDSNHSKNGFVRPSSEHHYEQPMVVFPPSTSPADSIGKPPKSESSSSTSNDRGHSSPMSTTDRNFPITSTPLPSLPTSTGTTSSTVGHIRGTTTMTDPRFTVWTTVTPAGSRINIPESGVSLTIPPGALSTSADLFVGVIHDAVHYPPPRLSGRETLLSPLVVIGPPEAAMALKKPLILSLPHCGSLRHGNWSVSCLHRPEDEGWKKVVTLGNETINTPVYVQLDVNTCHIVTDTLGAFALSGESVQGAEATKSLKLAAFAQEGHRPHTDLTVRVYCLQDTEDALSYVSESEKRYNGFLLDEPISLLFKDSEGDRNPSHLCLKVESLGRGWTTCKGTDYLEVPFAHIWNSGNPTLHCSFTFKATFETCQISFSLGAHQKYASSQTYKSHLAVNADLSSTSAIFNSLRRPPPPNTCPITNPLQNLNSHAVFRLSQSSVQALCRLLDLPNSQGNDWRLLAERLNVHRYITYFATRPSPTECILNLWEARNREHTAPSNLHGVLKGMGRYDAASVLERDLDIR